jgi:hypothetical protein
VKLVVEVKEQLGREHLSLPTGSNGRDNDNMILWFLKDRKFSVDEVVSARSLISKSIAWSPLPTGIGRTPASLLREGFRLQNNGSCGLQQMISAWSGLVGKAMVLVAAEC